MQLEFDLDVGALYIRVGNQPVSHSRDIDGNTTVDLATDGSLVGIEVISLSHPWAVDEVLRDCRMPREEFAQVCGYFGRERLVIVEAGPLPEPPQLTLGPDDLRVERAPVLTTAV